MRDGQKTIKADDSVTKASGVFSEEKRERKEEEEREGE